MYVCVLYGVVSSWGDGWWWSNVTARIQRDREAMGPNRSPARARGSNQRENTNKKEIKERHKKRESPRGARSTQTNYIIWSCCASTAGGSSNRKSPTGHSAATASRRARLRQRWRPSFPARRTPRPAVATWGTRRHLARARPRMQGPGRTHCGGAVCRR